MNITHVSFGFTTGGAELMMADIMAEQARAGHNVTLIVINRHYEQPLLEALDNRIRVITLNRPEGSHNPLWYLRYNLSLTSTKPQIVHFHSTKASAITITHSNVRYVETIHDTMGIPQKTSNINCIFAISKAAYSSLLDKTGIKSTIIHNGILTHQVKHNANKPKSLNRRFRIIVIARLIHETKGQDIAIEAIRTLKETCPRLTISLDLIGEGSSESFLRALSEKFDITDAVNFLGNRSRDYIYSHLCDYDLFLLPSRYEGFGLTVAEAMAAKVPVLVSDIEGPMEVIANGLFGSHFRCGDPDDCATAIARIIADYPRFLSLAQTDAYRHVTCRYDISRTAADYLRHYAELT